jgi:hypothetical protein
MSFRLQARGRGIVRRGWTSWSAGLGLDGFFGGFWFFVAFAPAFAKGKPNAGHLLLTLNSRSISFGLSSVNRLRTKVWARGGLHLASSARGQGKP